MHPYYGALSRLVGEKNSRLELISMTAYLLFWAAAIPIAIRMVTRAVKRTASPPAGEDAAIAILRERYARGEIEYAEFRERKSALEADA